MEKRKFAFIIGIILLIFILVRCTMQSGPENTKEEVTIPEIDDSEGENDDLVLDNSLDILTIKKPIHITPIYLITFEDVYIYYSMLEESKNNLRDKYIEYFLSINTSEIAQKGFSKYYGDIGRELVKECQRFKMVFYIGTGEKEIGRHFYRYHEFYVNNQDYFNLGENLIKIESYLNNSDYENALKYIKITYENIVDIREQEDEEKSI